MPQIWPRPLPLSSRSPRPPTSTDSRLLHRARALVHRRVDGVPSPGSGQRAYRRSHYSTGSRCRRSFASRRHQSRLMFAHRCTYPGGSIGAVQDCGSEHVHGDVQLTSAQTHVYPPAPPLPLPPLHKLFLFSAPSLSAREGIVSTCSIYSWSPMVPAR